MKKFIALLLFAPLSVFALDTTEVSEECLVSMRNLYKFYYHEIQPNPKNENCKGPSEKLGPNETAAMEVVIGEIKKSCPADFIGKVNFSLATDTNHA